MIQPWGRDTEAETPRAAVAGVVAGDLPRDALRQRGLGDDTRRVRAFRAHLVVAPPSAAVIVAPNNADE